MSLYRSMSVIALVALIAAPVVAGDIEDAAIENTARLDSSMLGKVGGGADGSILDSISLNGSVDVGFTHNFNNSKAGGPENPVRVFDRFHNEFTLHNAILSISRPVSAEQAFGFQFTPSFGADSLVTDFVGDGQQIFGDVDVLAANVQAHVMGAKVTMGKFITRVGGEVIESYRNPNFSRSFLFGNVIPFTHLGVEVEKGFQPRQDGGDMFKVALGVVNGWDQFNDTNDTPSFLAHTTVAPVEWASLTFNWCFGVDDVFAAGDNNDFSNLLDLVATVDLGQATGLDGLKLSGNLDWYGNENGNSYADVYGFAGILSYETENTFTATEGDTLLFAFRGEFVDNPDGFLPGTGAASQLWDLTGTVGYRPSDWFLVRLEVRHDKADAQIFEDGSRHQQTTVAVNTVFSF